MPNPRPGFPLESTERALGLWLTWFLTEVRAYDHLFAYVRSNTTAP